MPAWFAATLFVSAGLLFVVQPMLARMLLPRFGGTPAVWNTCLVFFQAALLVGYTYAHLLGRLPLRRQGLWHAIALVVALALTPLVTLPFGLANLLAPSPEANPIPALLALLAVAVGLPFVVASATAPLVQRWFGNTGHATARDPYFLYAASNLGSMIALIGYPLCIERLLPLAWQAWAWVIGYGLLVILVVACAVVAGRSSAKSEPAPVVARRPEKRAVVRAARRWRWLALAAVPSSLLYGVTTYLTTDVASMPWLWIIPLVLYLLTFILVFARRPPIPHGQVVRALPLVILGQVFVFPLGDLRPVWVPFLLYLATFFIVCLACHGELANDRPTADHLTEFYLLMSAGGALGGLFNTFLAPVLFETAIEYPLALVCACALMPSKKRGPALDWADLWVPLLFFLGLAIVVTWVTKQSTFSVPVQMSLTYGLGAAVCYTFAPRPIRFALGVGAVLLATSLGGPVRSDGQAELRRLVYQERSFYGIIRVVDKERPGDPPIHIREFVHGSTIHGMQRLPSDAETISDLLAPLASVGPLDAGMQAATAWDAWIGRRNQPLAYYFPTGPLGQVFAHLPGPTPGRRIAVLGLGAGGLAAYGRAGEAWDFYELDPAVPRVAERYFTYLGDCRKRGAAVRVVVGDARLSLENAPDHHYDVIIADAFSSDAVPVHLLTQEALTLYRKKLAKGGILVFNIRNRYLDLAPVLARLVEKEKLAARVRQVEREDITEEEARQGKTPSRWVVMAESENDLADLANDPRWQPLQTRSDVGLWTDDFSNLLSVFRWGR